MSLLTVISGLFSRTFIMCLLAYLVHVIYGIEPMKQQIITSRRSCKKHTTHTTNIIQCIKWFCMVVAAGTNDTTDANSESHTNVTNEQERYRQTFRAFLAFREVAQRQHEEERKRKTTRSNKRCIRFSNNKNYNLKYAELAYYSCSWKR